MFEKLIDFFERNTVRLLPKRLVARCAYYAIMLITSNEDRFREMSVFDLIKRLDKFYDKKFIQGE